MFHVRHYHCFTTLLIVFYRNSNRVVNSFWEVYDTSMINAENKYQFIGKKIREAREAAGLSQRQLSDELGYESSTAVSYMEAGERKVSVVDLEKLSRLLDKDIRYFLGQEAEQVSVRVALRAEEGLDKKDQDAILHIIEMAKNRSKDNGNTN